MPDPSPTVDICIMVLAAVTAWSGVLIRAVGSNERTWASAGYTGE